ncbi:hypothetical protein ACFW04_003191 [Cataglyphis niger]
MKRFPIVVLLCLLCFSLKIAGTQNMTISTCTEVGFFEIDDGTCKNYYMCIDNGVTLTKVILSCASSAIFDPILGRCVPANTTTCQQTPRCLRYGRFPMEDPYCKMYFLCYWNGTGYTMMSNLTCPNTLVFEPTSEKCVPPQRYICPTQVYQSNSTKESSIYIA